MWRFCIEGATKIRSSRWVLQKPSRFLLYPRYDWIVTPATSQYLPRKVSTAQTKSRNPCFFGKMRHFIMSRRMLWSQAPFQHSARTCDRCTRRHRRSKQICNLHFCRGAKCTPRCPGIEWIELRDWAGIAPGLGWLCGRWDTSMSVRSDPDNQKSFWIYGIYGIYVKPIRKHNHSYLYHIIWTPFTNSEHPV